MEEEVRFLIEIVDDNLSLDDKVAEATALFEDFQNLSSLDNCRLRYYSQTFEKRTINV